MTRKPTMRPATLRLLLLALLASTLLTGCVQGIALQALDAAVGGAYIAIESWANGVVRTFLSSLAVGG